MPSIVCFVATVTELPPYQRQVSVDSRHQETALKSDSSGQAQDPAGALAAGHAGLLEAGKQLALGLRRSSLTIKGPGRP